MTEHETLRIRTREFELEVTRPAAVRRDAREAVDDDPIAGPDRREARADPPELTPDWEYGAPAV